MLAKACLQECIEPVRMQAQKVCQQQILDLCFWLHTIASTSNFGLLLKFSYNAQLFGLGLYLNHSWLVNQQNCMVSLNEAADSCIDGMKREAHQTRCGTAQHSTAQHSTAQHSTAQHSTPTARPAAAPADTNSRWSASVWKGGSVLSSSITPLLYRRRSFLKMEQQHQLLIHSPNVSVLPFTL